MRKVAFTDSEDFFEDIMLTDVENNWNDSLGQPVPSIPSFETMIGELRTEIATLLSAK